MGSSGTEVSTSQLPLRPADAEVRLGVDGLGSRHLLISVGEGDEPKADNSDGAVAVRIRTYTFGGTPRRFIDVVCSRRDLFDLFDDVLVDVLGTLASDEISAPAEAAVHVVQRWRALFATRPQRLLTTTGQMSLVGELHVLGVAHTAALIDVMAWRGPYREPHDIVLPHCALEVKAVGATSSSVEVHGVDQLDPPSIPLALVLVRITEAKDGERLPDVVDRTLAVVSDRAEALKRLAAAGYSPADAEQYEQRFAIHGVDFVIVDDSVPRIVPSSFASGVCPVGVEGVTYQVMLDALDHLLVRGETLLRGWIAEVAA
jgi:hypothetical protein